ncbi:hypothetical protein E2C01_071098 [Portunus trituberculatus]|uniref:Uncharacterized protein n=1 Tax=Portunus trituberculatus TaxID=210409 RepID=A0A5B7I774_PORTR|nr:hypothetical protein [Portunus trituberculatus]
MSPSTEWVKAQLCLSMYFNPFDTETHFYLEFWVR